MTIKACFGMCVWLEFPRTFCQSVSCVCKSWGSDVPGSGTVCLKLPIVPVLPGCIISVS